MSAESAFQELLDRVRAGRATKVTGLAGVGAAHATWSLAAVRPVVYVARGAQSADEALRDLKFVGGPARAARVLSLPADERTPYHATSPDPLAVMERAATLHKLATGAPLSILVVTPEGLCRRGLPFDEIQRTGETIAKDGELDRDALVRRLLAGGYTQVNTVEDAGTFAVRGSIVDVYWAGYEKPFRVDLFGDLVESIKHFDPDTQRALHAVDEVSFGPAREVHVDDATLKRAIARLRDLADAVEYPTKKLRELLSDLENRVLPFGVEGLLPAFYERLETPLQVLSRALGPKGFTILVEDPDALRGGVDGTQTEYVEHHRHAVVRGDLVFPVDAFLIDADAVDDALAATTRVDLLTLVVEADPSRTPDLELRTPPQNDLRSEILKETVRTDGTDGESPASLLAPLVKRLRDLRGRGRTVLLPVATLGGVDRLKELLRPHHLEVRKLPEPGPDLLEPIRLADPAVHAWAYVAKPTDPARGAELPWANVAVIAEEEIFGKRARRQGAAGKAKGFKTTLADIQEGDFVVHVEHGVGRFEGLTRLNVRGVEQDYLLLTYDGGDKLYLPVHRINLVQRYQGPGGKDPRLDKLGGTGWETTRTKVKKAVLAMAQDLLNLYARRELAQRTPFPPPDEAYWEFEAAFPFETTPDQQKAIDDVLKDMTGDKPMDRLVCGDVGYGKTEVGMRAAMLAVNAGKQVAVLAPTTVLAQQHFITFSERFKATGASVEVISRFRKPTEVKDVLKRASEGKVDVLIGTHRLLSPDVSFKNLGLVLVDEEQRFGVKAKEALKKLKASVDMVTLTATPIPRTLQMSFFGIRDMSVIETPPVDRRAIRTSIIKFDDEVIREAMLRELGRGGQVYFVHNRVRSIQATADYVKRLVPEARVGIGHGQMDADALEDVMLRFMKHEINVLVCTAIIETGIDVPSANTMFVDHAEDFGLAQLYQLRGRVGRSKERAFAYLLIPGGTETLHPDARKRLEILQRFSDLGAGFQVAQHDLELRGAGDLLGANQHGNVTAVGYDMYAELLRQAVEELKGRAQDDAPDPDVELPVAAYLPDDYIRDVHERLGAYQRLAVARDGKEIYDVVGSLADQYGDPPPEVTALADVMILKLRLKEMAARALEIAAPTTTKAVARAAAQEPRGPTPRGIKKAPEPAAEAANVPRVVITLGDKSRLDSAKVAAMVAADPTHVRLTPSMKLVYTPTEHEWKHAGEDVLALCREVLRRVLERCGPKAKAA